MVDGPNEERTYRNVCVCMCVCGSVSACVHDGAFVCPRATVLSELVLIYILYVLTYALFLLNKITANTNKHDFSFFLFSLHYTACTYI